MKLKAANVTFPDISPQDGQHVQLWGSVVAATKQFKTYSLAHGCVIPCSPPSPEL